MDTFPFRFSSLRSSLLFLVMLVSLLAACSNSSSASNNQSTLPTGKGPMPTVIVDNTAPSNLDVQFNVNITESTPPKLVFTVDVRYHNAIVEFQHGEKVQCNGITTDNQQSQFISPAPPAGTMYNCIYTSPQGQANFSFTIPQRPAITSPASGSTIVRSTSTRYGITVLPNCIASGVTILYTDLSGGMAGYGANTSVKCSPDQTVDTSSFDTSSFSPGPGFLGVEETIQPSYSTNNPGFHTFTMQIYTSAMIPVIWQ